MRILVVGAGAQGAPAIAVLARQPGMQVALASRSAAAAVAVVARHGNGVVQAVAADAGDPVALAAAARQALGGVDAVLDFTPSFLALSVMRAALLLSAHYVNTAASPAHLAEWIERRPLQLAAAFAAAGRTALLSCGASPGVVNVLVRRHCDELDTVDRIEIRVGFHVPSQRSPIATWQPTWSPEQQYFDYCDPPCLFHGGRHQHLPPFHEPERYDFGGRLGAIALTHHAHDEQYSLPLTIGKGIRHCAFKYPFEPAVATLFATGFTPDKVVRIGERDVRVVDVLMALLPRPASMALADADTQRALVPLLADTVADIAITGSRSGILRRIEVRTGAFCDQAEAALDAFGVANVAVAYPAIVGLAQIAGGGVPTGIVWPEQLDPEQFHRLAASLGLPLRSSVVRRDLASGSGPQQVELSVQQRQR
ncbi:MAG: saccharopine dehydrogenase NADP-binding domain-containing protein [Planctomycetes bacterium]|nr:saccharopine dehydrogenase NADP-binding domain-containing protein [Planctomycetota bacterium]